MISRSNKSLLIEQRKLYFSSYLFLISTFFLIRYSTIYHILIKLSFLLNKLFMSSRITYLCFFFCNTYPAMKLLIILIYCEFLIVYLNFVLNAHCPVLHIKQAESNYNKCLYLYIFVFIV